MPQHEHRKGHPAPAGNERAVPACGSSPAGASRPDRERAGAGGDLIRGCGQARLFRDGDPALAEYGLPQKVIDKLVAEVRAAKPVDPVRSQRVVDSMSKPDHREYQYRPAYGDFGFSPVKSTRGKLSKAKRAQIQEMLDYEKANGLEASAESVEDWWEKKKQRTREARNARRRKK